MTIGYLPVGRDATISIGHADLKFKNNRDHHILIGAELNEGRLTFRLFGPPMEERVEIFSSDIVRLEPPVHYEESDALPEGAQELVERGRAGYHVKTWRVVYRGDREISRELLSHDHYLVPQLPGRHRQLFQQADTKARMIRRRRPPEHACRSCLWHKLAAR